MPKQKLYKDGTVKKKGINKDGSPRKPLTANQKRVLAENAKINAPKFKECADKAPKGEGTGKDRTNSIKKCMKKKK